MRLSEVRALSERVIHQVVIEDVSTSDLGLGVGVYRRRGGIHGGAVGLAIPVRARRIPHPRMELICEQGGRLGPEADGPFVHVVKYSERALNDGSRGQNAEACIEVELLGKRRIKGGEYPLDGRLGPQELVPITSRAIIATINFDPEFGRGGEIGQP
jgi:hypothetical protein